MVRRPRRPARLAVPGGGAAARGAALSARRAAARRATAGSSRRSTGGRDHGEVRGVAARRARERPDVPGAAPGGIRWAFPLALAFAFGTNTWMISSQALWQHGSGELLIALALLLVRRPRVACAHRAARLRLRPDRRQPPTGRAHRRSRSCSTRLVARRRDAKWLARRRRSAAGGAALLQPRLHRQSRAAATPPPRPRARASSGSDPLGLPGLLVSPARGLLVFTPFLVFVGVGLRAAPADAGHAGRWPSRSASAVVAQLLLYSQADWRAGVSWGPRWLTDLLPILVWMLAPAPRVLRPLARRRARRDDGGGGRRPGDRRLLVHEDERRAHLRGRPDSMRAAWKPANTPFVVELRHGRAPGELHCGARGSVERIGPTTLAGDGASSELAARGGARGLGARRAGARPAQVMVLIDGAVIGATRGVHRRGPDVDRAMHTSAPSGWRVVADTRGVAPGEHVLQLAVRIAPRSDIRIVREETRGGRPASPSLADAGRACGAAPARRPGRRGLLAHRPSRAARATRAPQQEMNTYLTSMLVDLLAPIARRAEASTRRWRAPGASRARRSRRTGWSATTGCRTRPTIGTLGLRDHARRRRHGAGVADRRARAPAIRGRDRC